MSRQSAEMTVLAFSWLAFWCLLVPGMVLAEPQAHVLLTSEEKAWLRECPKIRLGVDPDASPTEFVSRDGAYLGIASDMVRFVSDRLGINFEVQKGLTWAQVIEKAKEREIDVLPCVARTRDREKYLLFTSPYLNVPVVIVTRNDSPYIGGTDDLRGRTLAVVKGYQLHERLARDHPDIGLLVVNSTKEALHAVSGGKAFAFPGNLAHTFYLIPKLGISNLKVAAPTVYSFAPCFGVRNDWPELQSILDKALKTLSAEERTGIAQKWISLNRFYGLDYSLVLKWLGAAAVLVAFLVLWNLQIRRQKRIVKESEQRLQTIMDSVPNVVFVTDKKGRKVLVNREWERITKRARSDAVGKTYDELYPKRLADKLNSYDRKVVETLRPVASEETLWTADGRRTFVQTLVPLLDSSGQLYAVCGSTTDISERKRAEELLQQAFDESNRLLADAAHYVKALLPEPMSKDGIAVDWRFDPSAALGGDCFGYHWLDNDHFALYLLDVSGHGVSASLLAVAILTLLRSQTLKDTDFYMPESVLTSLNNAFPMEEHNGMYFTSWYGVYQRSSRTLCYSSAGHPPALLFQGPSGVDSGTRRLCTPNLFIGGCADTEYEAASITLEKPCSLYLFSDGVFEVEDSDGTMWGFDKFREFVARCRGAEEPVLERLVSHVKSLRQAETLEDDFSIVEVHFQ